MLDKCRFFGIMVISTNITDKESKMSENKVTVYTALDLLYHAIAEGKKGGPASAYRISGVTGCSA